MLRRCLALAITPSWRWRCFSDILRSISSDEQTLFAEAKAKTCRESAEFFRGKGITKKSTASQSGTSSGNRGPTKAEFWHRILTAVREGGAEVVSDRLFSYDDFSIAGTNERRHAVRAYAAYYDGHDQIRLHRRLDEGRWSTRMHVPLVQARADIWMPQLAVDAKDRVWVIWCEQTGQSPARAATGISTPDRWSGDAWGPFVRLTDDPKPDINPHVAVDKDRNIHVVWQAHPEQQRRHSILQVRRQRMVEAAGRHVGCGKRLVSARRRRQRRDCVDRLRQLPQRRLRRLSHVGPRQRSCGKVIPIADSSYYEAHASVACTPDGKVWVAWEQGGHNWGKDQGYWLQAGNSQSGDDAGKHAK